MSDGRNRFYLRDAAVVEYRLRLKARVETTVRESAAKIGHIATIKWTMFEEFMDAFCDAVAEAVHREYRADSDTLLAKVDNALARVRELEADKARLDYLEYLVSPPDGTRGAVHIGWDDSPERENVVDVFAGKAGDFQSWIGGGASVREALDDSMQPAEGDAVAASPESTSEGDAT
jgi:hypothetical protein